MQRPAQPDDSGKCIVRFSPPNAEFGLDPYVIAFSMPAEFHSVTFDEFASVINADLLERMISETSFGFGRTRAKVECGRAVFDKHRGRMTATYSTEFAGLRWKGVFVSCFGRDGGTTLAFNAMEKDFAAAQPAFDSLVESFRFDDGHGWEDAFPFASIDWGAAVLKAALIAGIGVFVAVAVWFVRTRESKADVVRARERLRR